MLSIKSNKFSSKKATHKSPIHKKHSTKAKKTSKSLSQRTIRRNHTNTANNTPMKSTLDKNNVQSMSTIGFGRSEDTSRLYDAIRPSYSPKVLTACLEPIYKAYFESPGASKRPMRILDLGCGTGIFTKLLALELYKKSTQKGGIEIELYCSDPNEKMLAVLKEDLTIAGLRAPASPIAHSIRDMSDDEVQGILNLIKTPDLASVDGLPYQEEFFDGIVAAQAFHWFSTPQAVINIQRCLTPHGIFSFCWNYWLNTEQTYRSSVEQDTTNTNSLFNVIDLNTIPPHERWVYKFAAVIEPLYVETDTPHQRTTGFHKLFTDGEQYQKKFGVPAPFGQLHSAFIDTREETTRWMNRDLVHKRMDSISVVNTLPKDRYEAFIKIIDEVLDHPDTPCRVNEFTKETEWPIGFWNEVHYAQNSKSKH